MLNKFIMNDRLYHFAYLAGETYRSVIACMVSAALFEYRCDKGP